MHKTNSTPETKTRLGEPVDDPTERTTTETTTEVDVEGEAEIDDDDEFDRYLEPYLTEADQETAKQISEHLIAGLKDGSVIAEGGTLHPLMVTITLAEFRNLVAERSRLLGQTSDAYVQRIRADQLQKEVEDLRKRNEVLTERLVQAALKGVGVDGQ